MTGRIMFMQEYKVLDSAPSAEQLQRKLKSDDFNTYGEPFTPEFVYGAIRQLPRFASMRVRCLMVHPRQRRRAD